MRKSSLLLSLAFLIVGCQPKEPQIPVELARIPFTPHYPVEVAVNPATGYVYITNQGNHVGVLQGLELVASLETDPDIYAEADRMAVDEINGWVYVVNQRSDTVAVIQGTEVMAVLEVNGNDPGDVAVETNSGWAYVVSGYQKDPVSDQLRNVEGNVIVFHGPEVVGTIPLGRVLATHVVADPVNGYVYVGGGASGKDVVVVLKGLEEVARFDVGVGINAMDVNPDTGDVYVTGASLELYQFRDAELVHTLKVAEGNGSIRNMRVHPVTEDIYLLNWGDQVEVIIVQNMRVSGRIPIQGGGPLKMTIDAVTGNVYIANFFDDTVTVIHGTETIATLEVGWYPYGIGVNPANGWVYVSNTNEGTVSVLGFQE